MPQVADDKCHSCTIGVCYDCPPGKFRAGAGAVGLDQCDPCPEGQYSEAAGAVACSICLAGSYVTDVAEDTDGVGLTSGGKSCNAW